MSQCTETLSSLRRTYIDLDFFNWVDFLEELEVVQIWTDVLFARTGGITCLSSRLDRLMFYGTGDGLVDI